MRLLPPLGQPNSDEGSIPDVAWAFCSGDRTWRMATTTDPSALPDRKIKFKNVIVRLGSENGRQKPMQLFEEILALCGLSDVVGLFLLHGLRDDLRPFGAGGDHQQRADLACQPADQAHPQSLHKNLVSEARFSSLVPYSS